jgi:putative tricarboxylic transport membrane protein
MLRSAGGFGTLRSPSRAQSPCSRREPIEVSTPDGISFVPIAIGLFGIAEMVCNLEQPQDRKLAGVRIANLLPTRAELTAAFPAMLRGTGVGCLLGVLPGGGAALPPFSTYALEKKIAADPSRFGKGAIEGVASPEAANNAGAQTSFVPMLTLSLPTNPLMALMIGALMIQGIQPGPQVMTKQPDLFWGVIASMWIGNLMLIIINLPLIGICPTTCCSRPSSCSAALAPTASTAACSTCG